MDEFTYSHCELIFSDGMFFSADPRDSGVRYKCIEFDISKWDFVNMELDTFDENMVRRWCNSKVGRGYDWLGIILGQAIPLGIDDSARYFCSEICVGALQQAGRLKGLVPSEVNPQDLYSATA